MLEELRPALKQERGAARLLVPTATMAEHLRNQLAREGYVFAPNTVDTFSKFIEEHVNDVSAFPSAALEMLVTQALGSSPDAAFGPLAEFKGFRKSLAGLFEELSSAGCRPQHVPHDELRLIYSQVENAARRHGWHFRSERLKCAAERMKNTADARSILFAGFYSFTKAELDIIEALAQNADILITLPVWSGSQSTLQALRAMGCEETTLTAADSGGLHRVLVAASTLDLEVNEIARRIREEHKNGRPFREIAIVVRSEKPYVPALKASLERFEIPARFYFGEPLQEHEFLRYFRTLIDAMLSGWPYDRTLPALRMSASAVERSGNGDKFEHRAREAAPANGLASLRALAGSQCGKYFDKLDRIDSWHGANLLPAEWRARFHSLCELVTPPRILDEVPHETAMIWRRQAAALPQFEEAVDQAAALLHTAQPVSCSRFWETLQLVLDDSTLRVPDHRRDVVHVIDAYEARQWKLPVIFICGLVEKQFPKYHSDDPILPDRLRRDLQARGFQVKTSADRQDEEQFLFDLATTRASQSLVLSFPEMNSKGDANLASFFLDKYRERYALQQEGAITARPRPAVLLRPQPVISVYTPSLREAIKQKHAILSPTGIESYLQCPFQFFAKSTLHLNAVPSLPQDRLDILLQGSLAHKVLERVYKNSEQVEAAFDTVFEQYRVEKNIPDSYRTEAVRLELLHHIGQFVAANRVPRPETSYFEKEILIPLDTDIQIRGRIDRLDVDSHRRATIIDYKYKSEAGIKDTVKAHADSKLVQGGLYLLAIQAEGEYVPAGMIYCGFKRSVGVGGWVIAGIYTELHLDCTPETLKAIAGQAKETTLMALSEIRDGRIAPKPADADKCDRCDFLHVCRVETAAVGISAGGSGK